MLQIFISPIRQLWDCGVELPFSLIAHVASSTTTFNDMNRIFKKPEKSKKPNDPSLTINDTLGSSTEPATSTSTIIANTAYPMPWVPASGASASPQAADGIVSILGPSHHITLI